MRGLGERTLGFRCLLSLPREKQQPESHHAKISDILSSANSDPQHFGLLNSNIATDLSVLYIKNERYKSIEENDFKFIHAYHGALCS